MNEVCGSNDVFFFVTQGGGIQEEGEEGGEEAVGDSQRSEKSGWFFRKDATSSGASHRARGERWVGKVLH